MSSRKTLTQYYSYVHFTNGTRKKKMFENRQSELFHKRLKLKLWFPHITPTVCLLRTVSPGDVIYRFAKTQCAMHHRRGDVLSRGRRIPVSGGRTGGYVRLLRTVWRAQSRKYSPGIRDGRGRIIGNDSLRRHCPVRITGIRRAAYLARESSVSTRQRYAAGTHVIHARTQTHRFCTLIRTIVINGVRCVRSITRGPLAVFLSPRPPRTIKSYFKRFTYTPCEHFVRVHDEY